MQIEVPTKCMTSGQEDIGYEHILTIKYDADFYFLTDYSVN